MEAIHGPEGLAIFTFADEPIGSHILYVNDAFVRMSGYRADQLVGHSALLLAGARPNLATLRSARMVEQGGTYVARERKTRPDGTTYDVEVRIELLGSVQAGAAPRVLLTQRQVRQPS